MSILYNFFNTNGFVFEILIAAAFFCWWMDRRPHIWLRGLCTAGVLLAVSMLWVLMPFDNAWTKSIRTILFFVLCIGGVKACFAVSLNHAVFYVTAAGAAQHFSFQAARTLLVLCLFFLKLPDEIMTYVYPVLSLGFLFLCYRIFGKELRKKGTEQLTGSPTVLFLLTGMQLCTNIFQNLFDEYSVGAGYQIYTIYSMFDMMCCLFLLTLQCEIARKENEQQNNEILKHILFQQKQQMKISKETIELINIKCHDIKNQIATLGNHVSEEEILELKSAIDIYDIAFKTGNEALDVLMVEKLMLCESKGIRFDCMAEGRNLEFMKQSDIYSLFGNAIDNAIEAVEQIANPEKRCISVKARLEKGMLMIHFENFYEGELMFAGGLPQTTKQDKRYHGFGMKSIRMITEKYHGYLSIKAERGIFTLNILLPIPV